jgi:hypothetical protein
MDNAEALRALETIERAMWRAELDSWEEEFSVIRNHLTDPGYARVPEEAIRKNAPCELDISEQLAWAEGWNACRESMLAAATKGNNHD